MKKTHEYVDVVYPEIAKYFVNTEESHVYLQSNKKVKMFCQCCSKIYEGRVGHIIRRGNSTCNMCRDTISYPEKFMYNMLNQLDIDFVMHYHDLWTLKYIYDFVFEYKDVKYIIEMDGGLGHGNHGFKNGDIEKSIISDKEKDILAFKNGYKLIRIDCNYNKNTIHRFDYIRNNIIKELKDIFDLDKINFDVCNSFANSPLFYEIIDYYKTHTRYIDEICDKFHLKESCITNHLRNAMTAGIIPHDVLHMKNKYKNICVPIIFSKSKDMSTTNAKIIYCYEDAIAYDSVTTLAEKLGLNRDAVALQLRKFGGRVLEKHYCYYSDLPNDFDFLPKEIDRIRYKKIYQYNKEKTKLLHIYENKTFLPNDFDYIHVSAVCSGKRKSHKGYYWSYQNILDNTTAN